MPPWLELGLCGVIGYLSWDALGILPNALTEGNSPPGNTSWIFPPRNSGRNEGNPRALNVDKMEKMGNDQASRMFGG
jgi:hypothetical protein